MTSLLATEEQPALLDLSGEALNTMWVDENQALFIPNNPQHWKAHKLQVLLARLDKQAEKNPAQFNSTTYLNVLDKYTEVCNSIKDGVIDGVDEGKMGGSRDTETAAEDSSTESISMDA